VIFSIWPRVAVRLGDERYVFDRATLMFTEVAEIEQVTGQSYPEWQQQLFRFSLPAVAALLHILRKREGRASDFKTMQFAADALEVVPVHDDDTDYTTEEAAAELQKRIDDARAASNGAGPTPAANGQGSLSAAQG
jgi:hypothetical protein